MYVCMYVCHVCMYACMHVCMYVMYVRNWAVICCSLNGIVALFLQAPTMYSYFRERSLFLAIFLCTVVQRSRMTTRPPPPADRGVV